MAAEDPQPPINPYASPRASVGSFEAMPAEVLFGLARPIHASGAFAPELVRQTVHQAMGGSRLLQRSALALLAALLVWVAFSVFTLSVLVLLLSVFALVAMLRRLQVRWAIRDLCGEKLDIIISEHKFQTISHSMDSWCDWTEYARCTPGDSLVVLHHLAGHYLGIPRSFFASDDDWRLFVDLVRQKLPRKAWPRPGLAVAGPAPVDVDKIIDPADRAMPGAILGSGRLTYRDVVVAVRHLPQQRWIRLLVMGCILAAFLPLGIWLAMGYQIQRGDILVSCIAALLTGYLLVGVPRQQLRRLAKAGAGPFAREAILVSDRGVKFVSRHFQSGFLWGHYAGFRMLRHHVLLCFPSHARASILPRAFFSEADWTVVLAIVERNLPRI